VGSSTGAHSGPTDPALVAEIPPPRNVQFRFSGGLDFQSLALAPDGHAVAFGGLDDRGKIMLWVRPLDAAEAHPLLGTEGAGNLFWSPDSRTIGFFAEGKLKTIDASGGPTVVLTDAPYDLGGSWRQDGTILFSDSVKGLYRLTVGGKTPAMVVEADGSKFVFAPARIFYPTDATSFTSLAVTILR